MGMMAKIRAVIWSTTKHTGVVDQYARHRY